MSPPHPTYCEVAPQSPKHSAQLAFRGRWLRVPLGLDPATARNAREDDARHFVALDAEGDVVGCVSLLGLGEGRGKLFQMAVAPSLQRRGVGRQLVRLLEDAARADGLHTITMHARVSAIPFYASLGYTAQGPVFDEVTVPHRVMERRLDAHDAPLAS